MYNNTAYIMHTYKLKYATIYLAQSGVMATWSIKDPITLK